MNLALKIDVDTYRGTRDGVPRLVELLKQHGAGATFLFSLGPDHTGRAIKRVFRPGFLNKVRRTSVVSHYGVNTLLYGTLLPGPDIGRRCARHHARGAGRGLRGRHPHLGSRQLAGPRGTRGCGVDAARDGTGLRPLSRYLRQPSPGPRRGRLADEPPRLPADAAARLRLLLGHARHAAVRAGLQRARSSPARNCRPRCRRWTS